MRSDIRIEHPCFDLTTESRTLSGRQQKILQMISILGKQDFDKDGVPRVGAINGLLRELKKRDHWKDFSSVLPWEVDKVQAYREGRL